MDGLMIWTLVAPGFWMDHLYNWDEQAPDEIAPSLEELMAPSSTPRWRIACLVAFWTAEQAFP